MPLAPQCADQFAQAPGQSGFGKNFLCCDGIAHEMLGEEIAERRRIAHLPDSIDKCFRQFEPPGDESRTDVLQFTPQALARLLVIDHRGQWPGPADEVGVLLFEIGQLDAGQALQDELAGAVGLAHTGADQTGPSDGED